MNIFTSEKINIAVVLPKYLSHISKLLSKILMRTECHLIIIEINQYMSFDLIKNTKTITACRILNFNHFTIFSVMNVLKLDYSKLDLKVGQETKSQNIYPIMLDCCTTSNLTYSNEVLECIVFLNM